MFLTVLTFTKSSNLFSNFLQAVDFRLANVLTSLLSLVVGVILAFAYGWKMTLLVLCCFPFLVGGEIFFRKFL